jgi:3-methylcrotonyl-CoA carboxylase alpha subunit
VWGADRAIACDRMARALAEYRVVGVRTTIPVLERIVAHPDFRAGRLSTAFLERMLPSVHGNDGRHRDVAILAAVIAEYERGRRAALSAPAADGQPASSHDARAVAWRLSGAGTWTGR